MLINSIAANQSRHSGMDDRQGWRGCNRSIQLRAFPTSLWVKCGKQGGTCAAYRNPSYMDVNDSSHSWLLDLGNPCRDDDLYRLS